MTTPNDSVDTSIMNSRILLFTRVLQLVAGIIVLFFGYGIWLDVWLSDVSLGPTIERTDEGSTNALIFLMFVLPGLIVALGSYLQTIYYKTWAVVFVGIGGSPPLRSLGSTPFFSTLILDQNGAYAL